MACRSIWLMSLKEEEIWTWMDKYKQSQRKKGRHREGSTQNNIPQAKEGQRAQQTERSRRREGGRDGRREGGREGGKLKEAVC